MAIAEIAGQNTDPQIEAAKKNSASATVDYEAFLKLLIAQIKNQDPTNPADSTEFLSQLASFSIVEQNIQTNAKLDALLSASKFLQSQSIIGRTVASPDQQISGKVVSVQTADDQLIAKLDNGAQVVVNKNLIWGNNE